MAAYIDEYVLRLLDMRLEVLPPEAVTIGIPQAQEQERSLRYVLYAIWYENEPYGMYVCDGKTQTGLPGERIFILGHGKHWYAGARLWRASWRFAKAAFARKRSFTKLVITLGRSTLAGIIMIQSTGRMVNGRMVTGRVLRRRSQPDYTCCL